MRRYFNIQGSHSTILIIYFPFYFIPKPKPPSPRLSPPFPLPFPNPNSLPYITPHTPISSSPALHPTMSPPTALPAPDLEAGLFVPAPAYTPLSPYPPDSALPLRPISSLSPISSISSVSSGSSVSSHSSDSSHFSLSSLSSAPPPHAQRNIRKRGPVCRSLLLIVNVLARAVFWLVFVGVIAGSPIWVPLVVNGLAH